MIPRIELLVPADLADLRRSHGIFLPQIAQIYAEMQHGFITKTGPCRFRDRQKINLCKVFSFRDSARQLCVNLPETIRVKAA